MSRFFFAEALVFFLQQVFHDTFYTNSQATLVRNTTDENEARILYEYLAEASVVFPKVFPVM